MKPLVTEVQIIEIQRIIAPEQVLLLQEIKIRTILSVVQIEELAQIVLAVKATILLLDLIHQAQEATIILQLLDHTTQAQVVPAMVAEVEDHLAEVDEDNFLHPLFLNKKTKSYLK